MVDIQWSNAQKQTKNINYFTLNSNTSNKKNNLLGWVLPTSKALTNQDKYNIFVPDLGKATLNAVVKLKDNDSQGYNGIGHHKELEVGQPVVISFLGNKNKPVITHSYHFSVDEKFELNRGEGKYFPAAGNSLSQIFDYETDIHSLTLSSSNPFQPSNSPANNTIPGSYTSYTKDGQRINFDPQSNLSFSSENYLFNEGKRLSTFDKTLKSVDTQSKKLPYEISRRLERVYKIVNGEFIPDKIREKDIYGTPLGDITDYLFSFMDPVLERIQYLNSFVLGIEEYYNNQIEWFESSIIDPVKNLYKLWKKVFTEEGVLGLLGYEPLQIDINIGQYLDNLLSNFTVNSNIPLLNAIFGVGQWALKQAVLRGIDNLLSNINFSIGNIDFSNLGLGGSLNISNLISINIIGGGSADPTMYVPSKGSVVSITPPTIFSEGSPIYQTLKFGVNLKDNITAKAQELGFLFSDINNLVEGIALAGSNLDFYTDEIRRERSVEAITDLQLINPAFEGESAKIDEVSIQSDNNNNNIKLVLSAQDSPDSLDLIPVVESDNDFIPLSNEISSNLFSDNNIYPYTTPEDSTAVFSIFKNSNNKVLAGGVVVNRPSQLNSQFVTITAQSSLLERNSLTLQLLDSNDKIVGYSNMVFQSDTPDYDLYLGTLEFPDNDEISFTYRVVVNNNIKFPKNRLTRPLNNILDSDSFNLILENVEEVNDGLLITVSISSENNVNLNSINLEFYNNDSLIHEDEVSSNSNTYNFIYETDNKEEYYVYVKGFSSQIQSVIQSNSIRKLRGEIEFNLGVDITESEENYADLQVDFIKPFIDNSTNLIAFDVKASTNLTDTFINLSVDVIIEYRIYTVSKELQTNNSGSIRSILLPRPNLFRNNEGDNILLEDNDYQMRLNLGASRGVIRSEFTDITVRSNTPEEFESNSDTTIQQPFIN